VALHPIVQYYTDHLQSVVDLTTALANFETPTGSKPHVDVMCDHMHNILIQLGADVRRLPQEQVGDCLIAKWNADTPGKPLLFVMHMDTVWPLGTVEKRPIHVEGDRLIGPGTWDMKGSIACVLSALKGLRDRGEFPKRPIWALFTTDEETGSHHSLEMIKEYASQAALALVMEFAGVNGGLKTWRKGVATYTVTVKGKSSHAGNAPEKGINAVLELAHHTLAVAKLTNMEIGTTVAMTVANGGTAFNVIPDLAVGKVDVRYRTMAEAERIHDAICGLQPVLAGAVIEVATGTQRPPMEDDEKNTHAYQQARQIAAEMGFELGSEGSGGGSDGNFTSALGIPTLDGLGPRGEGAHAIHEQVVITSIPERVALLDGIIREWVS
jgi:glutamate carboxypeptidase